jgi:hypothetical protein
MTRLTIAATVAVLVVPASALAAKPTHPAHPTTPAPAPTVSYILHGTLSTYSPASGATNGSVTITVTASNYAAKQLVHTTLTFALSSKSKITLKGSTIANGDRGVVKVRGAKKLLAATAQAIVAQQVIDQVVAK